ncbi:MAG: WcaI family glycosyltransferase [Deinococcales bacterium]
MKILIISTNYHPELIGSGKYNAEMAEWLAARGHEVDVITAMPHYPAWQIDEAYANKNWHVEDIKGVKVYRSPIWLRKSADQRLSTKMRILLETSFNATASYWVLKLSHKPYDVIFAVCPPLQMALWPYLYRLFKGTPWFFHVQDLQLDAATALGMFPDVLAKGLYGVERFFFKRATWVSTITGSMQAKLRAKGVKEAQQWLLANWADTNFIRPLDRLNPLREALGFSPEDIIILYSGNMGEKQGLEQVIEAARLLKGEKRLKFLLVGQGAVRGRLEQLTQTYHLQNITFHDLLPWEKMPQLLALGDIHLVVQKSQAADLVMPSKLTNILAAGRASIITAEAGTQLYQLCQTYPFAKVIAPEGDLAGAIQNLAQASPLRERMAKTARHYAENFLAKDAILGEFEKKLLQILPKYA